MDAEECSPSPESEKVAALLKDISELRRRGKKREATEVQDKEKEIQSLLRVPENKWPPLERTICELEDFVQKFVMENEASAPFRVANQSGSDVIRNASGGLALRGIFLSKDTQVLSKERKKVLEVPENVELTSASKPPQDLIVNFESLEEEQNFQQCVHRTGLNISGGISANVWGHAVKIKAGHDSSQHSDESMSSRGETEYASVTKYSSVPMASCDLHPRCLRLSPLALDSLKQLQNTLRYECSDESKHRRCADFLYSYGSHVNCGTIVFGGIFEMKAETSKYKRSEKSNIFQMLSDVLRMSASVTGIVTFKTDFTAMSSSCTQGNSYASEQQKKTTVSIQKLGGLSTASDQTEWKKSLLSQPETWHVIDRGSLDELLPVWEILQNHVNDLEDSELLAQNLRKCWEKETNLLNQYPDDNLVYPLKEIEKKIASIQIWNSQSQDTFLKNCEKYVSECQHLKLSLMCPKLMWYEKFLCNTEVQRFIVSATQCIDQCENKTYLTVMTSSLLEPVNLIQVNKFPTIAQILCKLDACEEEVKLACITLEGAMESVRKTKIDFLKLGPEDTERTWQLCLHLYRTIGALQRNLKEKEKYADALVTGILILPFNGPQENSKYSLTKKDLESLLCQMEKIENILEILYNLNDTQRQAFLIYETLKGFRETGWAEKDCTTGVKIICNKLGKEISPKIKRVGLTEHGNVKHDLESLEEELFFLYKNELPIGTRKATEQKQELVQFLNSLDQAKCTGAECQSSKGNSDPAKPELLQQLGMNKYYPGKLSLCDVLDLRTDSLTDQLGTETNSIIWSFVQKLLMANSMARKAEMPPGKDVNTETELRQAEESELLDVDQLFKNEEQCTDISFHPLDITVITLLCSDQLLQQEIMSKMAMCQFAVPLLLPKTFRQEVSFLLWALRSIVKKWTPQSLIPRKGFIEDNMVVIKMPTVSFVRLGNCKESKSKILNEVLSDGHLSFFVNRHMEQGDIKRKMSDGVAEICWYLPSGNTTLDAFSEAFSVINLRGDAFQYSTQLCVLAEVSSAIFIFVDKIGEEEKEFITSHSSSSRSKLFLVMNISKSDRPETSKNLKSLIELLQLKKDQFVQFGKSSTDILKQLRERITNEVMQSMKTQEMLFSLEEMADVARKHGIFVDEDEDHLKKVKATVKEMMEILDEQSVTDFKKDNLHYQGQQWKTWSKVDKEQSRLKHRGAEPFGQYIDDLEVKKKRLREKQLGSKVSPFMTKFIEQIHSQDDSKMFFIQWLKLEIDSRSRKNLKKLHSDYMNLCDNAKLSSKDDTLKNIDKKISESSLGLEHLLREVGQIYEATTSYSTPQERSHYQQLPRHAAQLLLGGVPLELIDGDASNIPLQWIANVLEEIVSIVGRESRMLVVTVLGIQSTGKSTLLNTMFGLQFAVSSGRCTRGAFMQLLGVKGDLKKKLRCDFVMVIDTEGLKAQELAQLDCSYEHDNELATLVTGLSDLTLVNVPTENSTDMKDVLQIVVHAFIRMKEVGKRPNCQFIHQNSGDIAAHEKNVRDRMYFLDQLNEMTKVAARMEERERDYSSFGDVLEYDSSKSNWYIGSLWHGNPPMAAVSTGYSKNILDLKKHIFDCLEQRQQKPGTIHDFGEWLKNIWTAVKKENFIFSFKNSLVAEAYNQLSLQYCDWEWELREFAMSWTQESENKIKNSQTDLCNLVSDLECDLNAKVNEKIASCIEKLNGYFSSGKDNVHLVEGYKAEFHLGLQALSKELRNSPISKCTDTVSRQKGLQKLTQIQRGYQQQIETEVNSLLMSCKKQKRALEENELEHAFEDMWRKVISTFPNSFSERRNIACDMQNALFKTLQAHSHLIPENLNLIKEDHLSTFSLKHIHMHFKSYWKGKAPEKVKNYLNVMDLPEQTQKIFVYNIQKIIGDKVKENINYDQNFCLEILREIDLLLKNHENDSFKFTDNFRTDFKLHVSGHAVKQFEEMQDRFYKENDLVEKLGRQKGTYLEIFIDTYCTRDQTHKKAEMFCEGSLKPAIVECVKSKLGAALLEDLRCNRKSLALSTSKFFHASLLVNLMKADDFTEYYRYINHYEDYATEWVKKCVLKHCVDQTDEGETRIVGLACHILKQLSYTAKEVIKDAATCTNSNKISDFIKAFVNKMDRDLVIPADNLDLIAFQSGNLKDFADAVLTGVDDLEKAIEEEIGKWDVEKSISELPTKPTEELIKSLLNCKKQCPFCGVPCERAGLNHSDHFSEYHIPDGFSGYKDITSGKLSADICTVSVSSGETFRNEDTDYKYVAYKNYKSVNSFYKSWQIQLDSSYKATSYWKSVFYRFNKDFAKKYGAEPADIPEGWNISKGQVRKDLEETYQVSLNSIL
ncbi:interferon-induced very large GTPase 1-like [Anguilla anguilla]|uniref:interferon-induced very large GTPase 1-like n=1 Tax=Anguilla anguilla TaxID=7936 RepID=UPI0015B235D2|nr:interferon-induced very large GTPase 1-like [Anguilla anguilla]